MKKQTISAERLAQMKATLNGCPLMEDREKVSWEDLENSEITISEFFKMGNDEDHYYCIVTEEYPQNYMFSGSQLTSFIDEFGEDVKEVTLKVGGKRKTKNKRDFIPFTVV